MRDEFARSRMLLGDTAMETLRNASVAVFGIGGVGSYTAEALARSGIGHLALFDGDTVALSNINRQIIALHSTLGRPKAQVMAERIRDICPDTRVSVYNVFYSADNAGQYDLSGYTYIVDAIDTVSSKLTLIQQAVTAGVPVISSMGAGNKLDPTRFQVADLAETSVCPLARVMRRELKKRGIFHLKVVYSQEPARTPFAEDVIPSLPDPATVEQTASCPAPRRQSPGSLAFVPSVAGLILAGEVIRDISGIC